MIEIKNLKKVYGKKVVLDIDNLTFESGKIIGFLGHNGAGKTTLLNILASLVPATSGEVLLNKQPIFDRADQMEKICFIAETENFHQQLSIKQVLHLNKLFYPNWDEDYAEKLLGDFKLSKKLKVRNLSKGMVSALGIITGLASRTPVVIFDEPYIGLDAAARQMFYNLLLEDFTDNPRLIIMSTHLIDEAAELFNDVVILHEGKVLIQDSYTQLQERLVKLKGKKDQLSSFLQNKTVIHQKSFMTETQAIVEADSNMSYPEGITKESVKLQEVMVALSNQYREV